MKGALLKKKLLQKQEPLTFEQRLERAFPGSEWVHTQSGREGTQQDPDQHPGTLEMVCIGPGPGPKNVLATDGVVYPYAKFKALRGRPIAATASPPQEAVRPAAAIGVIGGAKFDEAKLASWLRSLPGDAHLVTGDGRGAEAKVRQLAEELGIRVDVPDVKKDLYGAKARDIQIWEVVQASGSLCLVGSGGRPDKVRSLEKDWARWKATLQGRPITTLP